MKNNRELWLVVLIYLFAIKMIAPWGNYPLNDDWYYSKPSMLLAQTGTLQILSGQASWSFPQIVFGAGVSKLFGFSHTILRILGIIFSILCGVLFHHYILSSTPSRITRIQAVLSAMFFAPQFINGLSFMSDIPFLLLWLISCWQWAVALKDTTPKNILVATALTVLTTAQRQFGILFVPTVFLYWSYGHFVLRKARLNRSALLIFSSLLIQLIAYAGFSYYWKNILSVQFVMSIPPPDLTRITIGFLKAFSYLGLAVSPFVFSDLPEFLKSIRNKKITLSFASVYIILFAWFTRHQMINHELMPYFGNQLSKFGAFRVGELIVGPRNEIIPEQILLLLTILSSISSVILLVKLTKWLTSISLNEIMKPSSFMIISGFVYFFGLLVLRDTLNDRYLIPALIAALCFSVITLIPAESKKRRLTPIFFTLAMLMSSTLITQDFMTWTQARWSAGLWLIDHGYKEHEINGGHEWNWWRKPEYSSQTHYIEQPEAPKTAIIKFKSPDDTEILNSFDYTSWLSRGTIIVKKIK